MTDLDLARARRDLLAGAVTDTEGTIRATDTKASIALILHGLLFSGLIVLTKDLGHRYSQAGDTQQTLIVACLAVAGAAFLASVLQLIRCVMPAPARVIPATDGHTHNIFFVKSRKMGLFSREMPSADELCERLQVMSARDVEQEWLSEVLKLAAIRERKTRLIKSGLMLLGAEVATAACYLALIGVSAA